MKSESEGSKPGHRAALVLRVLVSGGLIAFLLLRIDASGIACALGGIRFPLFGLGCLLFLCGQGINTERWWRLLVMARGAAPQRRFLLGLVFAGMFFNFFLPSTVGGDVARAELARNRIGNRTDAYLSIVIARLLALVAVLVIGLVASLVAWRRLGWFDGELALSTLVFLLPAVAILLVTRVPVGKRLGSSSWLPASVVGWISRVARSVRDFTRSRSGLAWIFALSVLAQLVGNIFVVWALATSLGIEAPIMFHLVAVPLITVITLLPISINGIGVREGGFVYFYAKIGVAADAAVALSLAYTAVLLVFSILGGLYLMLGRGSSGERAATSND